jgi:transcriptional regulator with XRE-family HTH domain
MAEGVEGIRGEYRRLTSAEVGLVIKACRELQGIKRAALAADANVSEKTIERAEAGEGVSEESARRIARALGMQERAFVDEIYVPTLEEIARAKEQQEETLRRTHRPVPVAPVRGLRDILSLRGSCAHFDETQHVSEEHLHAYADLKQNLVDFVDIADDLTEPDRVRTAAEILSQAREFERMGYVLKLGVTQDYRWRGQAWPCSVLAAFKKPKGAIGTPSEIWLPKETRLGL